MLTPRMSSLTTTVRSLLQSQAQIAAFGVCVEVTAGVGGV